MNKIELVENFKALAQVQKTRNHHAKKREEINNMTHSDDVYLKNILHQKLIEDININDEIASQIKRIPQGIYELKTNDINPYGVKSYVFINRRNIMALDNTAVYYINESMPRDLELIPITDMKKLKAIAADMVQLDVVNWDFNKNNKAYIKNFIIDCLMDEYPFD